MSKNIELVQFSLRNRTAFKQQVSLMNPLYGSGQSQETTTQYLWDLTTELAAAVTNNFASVYFIARPTSSPTAPYILYTATQTGYVGTITQALNLLNAAGLGAIFSNPSGNYIQCLSNDYVFSSLGITNIFSSATVSNTLFTNNGSFVYDPGYSVNGVGTITQINTGVPFWINTAANLIDGPMNRNAIWDVTIPPFVWIGGSASIYRSAPGYVYLGISSDNLTRVFLNNNLILNFDLTAMLASIVAQYPAYIGTVVSRVAFVFWHIFPVLLDAGQNIIQFQNENTGSGGAIGVEIYDNTQAEILASASYADLNILFRSANYTGQNLF